VISRLEHSILRSTRRICDHPAGVRSARAFSFLGEHAAAWLAISTTGALLDGRRRRAWLEGGGAIAAAHGTAVVLKRLIRRPRPAIAEFPALGRVVSDRSLPSAHAASSAAAAVALTGLLPSRTRPVLLAAVTATALSRLALTVHWPSDVALGAGIGAAWGLGATRRRSR
jgi:membrane-associated phospholipid phosphatase